MSFQVSPGVLVREIDLTNIVPAVSTSIGAMAGQFNKGPVGEVIAISTEQELVSNFGYPDSDNFETWFTAANFLQYGNALRVVRAKKAGMLNAAVTTAVLIQNDDDYDDNIYNNGVGSPSQGEWVARFPGIEGNSLGVSICANATAFQENLGASNQVDGALTAGAKTVTVDDGGDFNVGDLIAFSSVDASSDASAFAHLAGDEGNEYEITAIATNDLTIRLKDDANGSGTKTAVADDTFVRRRWKFYDQVDAAPGTSTWATGKNVTNDEIHVVVYDTTGNITGFKDGVPGNRAGSVIEIYAFVSQAEDAKTAQGGTNYYVNAINNGSIYLRWSDHNSSLTDAGETAAEAITGSSSTFASTAGKGGVITDTLTGGTNGTVAAPTVGELDVAYQFFADTATQDINLVMAGTCPTGTDGVTHATMIIDLCEGRKDCVGFISPRRADVVGVTSSITQTSNVKEFFDGLASSSYAVFDSGYKYMYDKYNDVYRFVPLNGDVAGLGAYTDQVADAWFSPAGYNRGQIRGAVKLAFNPNKAQRDILYPARINPVISEPGEGTILFGDKTALSRPSAFDRINVRRLFLVLEKAIANAAKFQLFEFNDDFTRAQFTNLVEPFLRDVQGRRGITDFQVICDTTNNTGEVIDRNEFVGDIFIKPARSINFIRLNFIAVRTGVEFSEIAG